MSFPKHLLPYPIGHCLVGFSPWLVPHRTCLMPEPGKQKEHLSSLTRMSPQLTGTYTGINQALPSLLKVPLLTLLRQDSLLLFLPWTLSYPSPCLPPIACTPVGPPGAAEQLDMFPAHGPQLPLQGGAAVAGRDLLMSLSLSFPGCSLESLAVPRRLKAKS